MASPDGSPTTAAVPTISMIAKELEGSRSTVSRAFTRPHLLRPETVEKVLAKAQTLGYVPNKVARALSTGQNGVIALIVPDIANPFFPPLIRAAQVGADRQDFCVLLGDSAENPAQESRLITRFTRRSTASCSPPLGWPTPPSPSTHDGDPWY